MNEVTITTAAQANEAHQRIMQLGHALLQARQDALAIGKFLSETKAKLPHGKYEDWVRDNWESSERSARYYKSLYERRNEIGWGDILALTNGENENGKGIADLEDPPDAAVPANPTPPAAVPTSATQALKKLTKPKQKPAPAKKQVPAPKASEEQQDDIWMAPFSVEKYPNTEGWNPGWNVVDADGRVFERFDLQEKAEAQAKVDELNAQAEADEDWFPPNAECWKEQHGCKPPKDDFRYVSWDGEKYWVTDTVGSLDEAFDTGAEAEDVCVEMNATYSRGWRPKGWKAKKYYVKQVEGAWVVLHLSLDEAVPMGLMGASFESPVRAEEFRAQKENETKLSVRNNAGGNLKVRNHEQQK